MKTEPTYRERLIAKKVIRPAAEPVAVIERECFRCGSKFQVIAPRPDRTCAPCKPPRRAPWSK